MGPAYLHLSVVSLPRQPVLAQRFGEYLDGWEEPGPVAFAQSLLGGCMGCGAGLGTMNKLEGREAHAFSMLETSALSS